MKICPKCNLELEENAKFCPQCGAALETEFAAGETGEREFSVENTAVGAEFHSGPAYSSQPVQYVQQRTNGMAIAGFVLSFFVPVLGIIFSAIGMKQTKENNEAGRGLAIAGLVISIVWVAIALILGLVGACTVSNLIYYWG